MKSQHQELIDHIKTFEALRDQLQSAQDLLILPDQDLYKAFDDLQQAIKALDSEIQILRRKLRKSIENKGGDLAVKAALSHENPSRICV